MGTILKVAQEVFFVKKSDNLLLNFTMNYSAS